jgi:hypothetical protein
MEKGITKTYFCGLAADICVYYTIKYSLKEGFSATLVEDARNWGEGLGLKHWEIRLIWLLFLCAVFDLWHVQGLDC